MKWYFNTVKTTKFLRNHRTSFKTTYTFQFIAMKEVLTGTVFPIPSNQLKFHKNWYLPHILKIRESHSVWSTNSPSFSIKYYSLVLCRLSWPKPFSLNFKFKFQNTLITKRNFGAFRKFLNRKNSKSNFKLYGLPLTEHTHLYYDFFIRHV